MSHERRRVRRSDTDHRDTDHQELLRALRNLGGDYEPDLAAIECQIQLEPVARAHPEPRRSAVLARLGRPVLLPVAAVLLVMGGIVLLASGDRQVNAAPTSGDSLPTSRPATSAPAQAPSVDPRPTPTTVLGTGTAGPTGPVASTRSGSPTRSSATPGNGFAGDESRKAGDRPAAGTAAVSVERLAPGATRAVDLVSPSLLDWVAVGTRSDLKQVRDKDRSAAPLLTAASAAGATSVPGPYRISWVDGLPEQDHSAAGDWLETDGTAGLSLSVAASSRARTLVLYAGAADLRPVLTLSGKGLTTRRTSLEPASAGPRVLIVTVSLPPTSGPTQIRLDGSASGQSPRIHLAAMTLR